MSVSIEAEASPVADQDRALRALMARLGGKSEMSDAELDAIFIAAARGLVARLQDGRRMTPGPADELTATEAMILATEILKRADLQLFELGMWQAMGGPS